MNPFLLYLLLLKATATSFSGGSTVAVVRDELVVRHRVLTDRQLATAVAVGRMSPGPNAVYLTSVGYFVAGVPGAVAGFAAMATPAFLIVPLMLRLGRRAESAEVKRVIRAVVLAAAGLVLASAIPLARDALVDWPKALVAVASCAALLLTRVDTAWIVVAAAVVGLLH
jgi:chromate transporter